MWDFEGIYIRLYEAYGPQGWWPLLKKDKDGWRCHYVPENSVRELNRQERFEICVGAILTQNTAWSNAERALICLAQADILDPDALADMDVDTIAGHIRSSGYYNQKAKKLKAFAQFYRCDPPPDRKLFLAQWGLGPETVDDMLLYAYNQPVFVIDIYTIRLFSRLGLCDAKITYHDLQRQIMDRLKQDPLLYKEYHALIVQHAKEHCSKKPDCSGCPLESGCMRTGLSD